MDDFDGEEVDSGMCLNSLSEGNELNAAGEYELEFQFRKTTVFVIGSLNVDIICLKCDDGLC